MADGGWGPCRIRHQSARLGRVDIFPALNRENIHPPHCSHHPSHHHHHKSHDPHRRIEGSGNVLNNDPRSICLNRNGKDCCISWPGAVGSVVEDWLYNAARAGQDRCVVEAQSAKAIDVQLGKGCVLQCLSDRATGCH